MVQLQKQYRKINIKNEIMKREKLIKKIAKLILQRKGLSNSIISGVTREGREITQLEEKEIELGTMSNYRLKKLLKGKN